MNCSVTLGNFGIEALNHLQERRGTEGPPRGAACPGPYGPQGQVAASLNRSADLKEPAWRAGFAQVSASF